MFSGRYHTAVDLKKRLSLVGVSVTPTAKCVKLGDQRNDHLVDVRTLTVSQTSARASFIT